MRNNTLVIIGGGAAGFFCAINAKRLAPRNHVIIVEKTGKLLSKVKISGGGRCNVTHGLFTPQELVQNYPRGHQFLKKALHHFHAVHTIQWFKEMGIELHQEADGRMFPTTNSSQTIIDCFLQEAERLGIEIRTHHAVTAIEPRQEGYMVLLQNGLALAANTVVLACGGYNQLLQYSWLQNLALTIEPPVPSLFTFNAKEHRLKSLMGVSVSQAIVQLVGTKYQQQGPVLITHWGLSGPAAIKLSAWVALELAAVHYQYTVKVNWLGETLEAATDKAKWMKQHQPKQKLIKNIFEKIPQRLWDWVLQETKIDTQQNWADINTKQ
ncbi:MAG: aminoacetone oxidase family FAD-binding enzyme, partial [Bacteroidetes bacterium]